MYKSDDVEMLVQDMYTEFSTRAWNEEYLRLRMQDVQDAKMQGKYYDVLSILLSKEQAKLLRDTLDVFIEGGYSDE